VDANCRVDEEVPGMHFCYSGYESNRMAQFVVADVSIILKPPAPSYLQIVSSLPSTMSFNLDIVLGYIHSHPIFETLPYFVHLGLCLWEPGQIQ
jgi:hypothetical protein